MEIPCVYSVPSPLSEHLSVNNKKMKEDTHIDIQITKMLHKLKVSTFSKENDDAVYELVNYIRDGILSLEQTQSSRHNWSILVEDIKKFFNPYNIYQ